MIAPPVVVLRSDPSAIEEIVRFVVDADAAVIIVVEAYGKCDAIVVVAVKNPAYA